METKNTGQYIKAARKAKGISAQAIADACHVNRTTYYRWENGDTSKINYGCILIIADYLGIPPESLFTSARTEGSTADFIRSEIDTALKKIEDSEKLRRIYDYIKERKDKK